jgi:hypothetical protein
MKDTAMHKLSIASIIVESARAQNIGQHPHAGSFHP